MEPPLLVLTVGQCYIGHRNLFQAIFLFQKTYPDASGDEFKLEWLPFYRDRSLPARGVPLEQRLVSAFGDERTGTEKAKIQRIGRAHGINFNLEGLIGQTRDCHRLVYFAGIHHGPDVQRALVEQIYFRWFEIGGDITSHSFLLDCAEAVQMDRQDAARILTSDQYICTIDQLDAKARVSGVSCVPTFAINGSRIEGAEDVSTFYETLVKAKETK